jgi:hypothetical protein
MHRQPPHRRLLLQRIAVYGVMILATVGLVTVLIFILLGYQFNRNDGRIEQGGLVQFESRPSGAEIMIDNAKLGLRTPAKTTLAAGSHAIKMERADYRTWQKSVDIVKGSILWLNYARLIPNQLTSSRAADLTTVSSTATSPDRKWMAIKEDVSTPVIRLADLSQEDIKLTNLDLPADSYSAPAAGKTQSFTIEKWDPTSRTMLVRHMYNDTQSEWIVVDSQNVANTKNISTLLGVNVSKVVFTGNTSAIFILVDGAIRKVDLVAATLSGPLVSNVTDVSLYDQSTLAYVTGIDSVTQQRSVGYLEDGGKYRTLRTYSDDGTLPLYVQIGKFFDDTYVAIAYNEDLDVLVGDLPRDDDDDVSATMHTVGAIKLAASVQFLSIKNNDRFVVAQAGATYTVYDHELQKMTTTTLKDTTGLVKELAWIDDYMLYHDAGGTLRTYEFDGANQQDIMSVAPGFSAAISPNNRYLYGIMQSSDGAFHLDRVRLLL